MRHYDGYVSFRAACLLLASLLILLIAPRVKAKAPEPFIDDQLLQVPVLMVFDQPYQARFRIITTTGQVELLLDHYEVTSTVDPRGTPSWDGELLNIPSMQYGGRSFWGEFSLTFTQPVLFRLERAEVNDAGSSGAQGKWRVSELAHAEACGEGSYTENYILRVLHVGSQLFVTTPAGEFEGSVEGNRLIWGGSYADDGGTMDVNIDVSFSGAFDSFAGTSDWRWSNGSSQCSGTSDLAGTLLHN